ncbi:MAG: DNA repair protein RecN, partial [Spirochaetota bacterium]
MLEQLNISGYALIDKVSVAFTCGLNILTGETGTGKSILVGALGLLLGTKGDTSTIRTGCDETVVSGIVTVENNNEALTWLHEHGIEPEDGNVIIRRILKSSGKGSIFIQSYPVTRNDLADFTSLLFDMHGQHEHQSLLSIDNHRKLLDRYGNLEDQALQLAGLFQDLAAKKKRFEKLVSSERERLREMDILTFAVREIENANLKVGEEEELEHERRILVQYEKLFSLLKTVYDQTAESRGGCLSNLRKARTAMDGIVSINPDLASLSKRLDDAFFEVEDVTETIRQYQSSIEFSADKLDACERRLAAIHNLEKKYGDTITDVLSYLKESTEQLVNMSSWEEDKESLKNDIDELEKLLLSHAQGLSQKRTTTAALLEEKVQEKLHALGMPKARFTIEIKNRVSALGKPVCGPYGIDSIEFTISPNQGEPQKPLKNIASGGELSRFMLAIKSVLAESDHIQSLIFDEIDSGIGGEIALAVGEHLHRI